MKSSFLITTVLFCWAATAWSDSPTIRLKIGPHRDLKIESKAGTAQLRTTGDNPHFWTRFVPQIDDPDATPILEFEYFATEPIRNVQIHCPVGVDRRTRIFHGTIPLSETWRWHAIDVRGNATDVFSDGKQRFLFQFGVQPNHSFQIRSIRLRPANASEQQDAVLRQQREQAKQVDADAYEQYLSTRYRAALERLTVEKDDLKLAARFDKSSKIEADQIVVMHLPPHVPSHQAIRDDAIIPAKVSVEGERIEVVIPRWDSDQHDRSVSRFRLYVRDNGFHPLGPAWYPTDWQPGLQRPLPKLVAKDRKGLGVPRVTDPQHEIFELGLSHATVNIVINALISEKPRPGWRSWTFEGETLFLNSNAIDQYAQHLALLRSKQIVPSMILLVTNHRNESGEPTWPLVHPDATTPGLYSMPDLATPRGAFVYRAIITHLADRFSSEQPDGPRTSNWIMHNEIDQAGTWTTMGPQPFGRYMETFIRSARLVHHVARRFDPHARVFMSLTHHWTRVSEGESTYCVRDMIDRMAEASRVEGDFDWGVAYHPYPRSLREPKTWNDADVTWDFDTPYITPRNIEVLPAYLDQPRLRFQGTRPRGIMLSEQGCNARSLSPEDQALQAAGIVYTFHRIRQLPAIESFQYHAYRDHPDVEGGLRLGLITETGARKRSWEVYQALNTPQEEKAVEFVWPIMGEAARSEALNIREVARP
ncbi:MAG: DUF5722 domain-containing protein [Pirellulaceae bacterium]